MVRSGSEQHRWSISVLAAGLAAALFAAACSGGSDPDAAGTCSTPSRAAAAEVALLPTGLSLDKVGTVTHVQRGGGRVAAQAVSTRPLDEVTVLIQDAVTGAGYRPAGMDSEEDEAEVFFTTGTLAAGQARVRQGSCEGQWNIDLDLVEPAATAPTR
jgi:hypothetical protein